MTEGQGERMCTNEKNGKERKERKKIKGYDEYINPLLPGT